MKRSNRLLGLVGLGCLCFSSSGIATETIGEAAEDTHKVFLRQSALLLEPGEISLDFSLSYARNQRVLFGDNYLIDRRLGFSTMLNVGVTERLEAFIGVPFTWGQNTLRTDTTARQSTFGIGDITGGAKYLLHQETATIPDLIWSVGVRVPTGKHPYKGEVATGSGHFAITNQITAIKAVDPAVIFGGLSGTYHFANDFNGHTYQPGIELGYRVGVGLAFNDKLTLSSSVRSVYQSKREVDSALVAASAREPLNLDLGFTYIADKRLTLETSVGLGLNEDSTDTVVSFTVSKKF